MGRKTSDMATEEEVLLNPAAFVQRKERGWTGCDLTQKLDNLAVRGLQVTKFLEKDTDEVISISDEEVDDAEPDMFAATEEDEEMMAEQEDPIAELSNEKVNPDEVAGEGIEMSQFGDTAELAGHFQNLHSFSSSDEDFNDSGTQSEWLIC